MRYASLLLLFAASLFAQTGIVNPQYTVSNPTDVNVANPSWSSYKLTADFVPPFDFEFATINIGHHDFRANAYTPRGSVVSNSSALLIGWTTPTDDECAVYGCRVANGQDAITVSMLAMNKVSPTVGLLLDVNPGVDNFNGVWGFNVNTSNHFHTSTGGSGIFGGEINISLDDNATDVPNPGVRGQSVGITVTESSPNSTGKRVSAAWGIGSAGRQNFHHGIWAYSSPTAQTPMDDLIHARGPITTALDLHEVQSGPVAIDMPDAGGMSLGKVTVQQLTTMTVKAGTLYFCKDCMASNGACYPGGKGSAVISTGSGWRCF